MNKEEFDSLKPGDVIQSTINYAIYVIVNGYNKEQITQKTRQQLLGRYAQYKIYTKVKK